jgi:pimeloyl-ACP methyl ester carboxylesterase
LIAIGVPHPGSLRVTPRLLWKARHFFYLSRRRAEDAVRANDFAMVDELVQRWSPKWNVPAGETDAVKAAFREPGSLNAALGYYRAASPRLPVSQRAKIRVPTACFAGTDDDIISVAAYERAASWFTGGFEVVTMPGGHFMHREHPATFVEKLLRVIGA